MIEMLETRKLDLVIDSLPIDSKKAVTKVTLSKLHNCFAYNKKVFSNININNIKDLSNYPIILPNERSSIRLKLNEYMESHNVKINPILESWTTEMMLDMVRKGIGIGYFIQNVINEQTDKDDFTIITFDNDLPAVDVCCVYIDDFLTTATRKFIELLTSNK
jgi:DNA-binding transcriptional LysR family regulator